MLCLFTAIKKVGCVDIQCNTIGGPEGQKKGSIVAV